MATVKKLRTKITSLNSTKKITKAMKMIAATRLSKAQRAVENSKEYSKSLTHIFLNSMPDDFDNLPFCDKREEKNVRIVLITSEKGLCGGFNSNLLKYLNKFVLENKFENLEIECLGRKGYENVSKLGLKVNKYHEGILNDSGFDSIKKVSKNIRSEYKEGKIDSVYMVYNKFITVLAQEPVARKLLSLRDVLESSSFGEGLENIQQKSEHIYQPGKEELLNIILPKYVDFTLYRAVQESLVGENAARMTSMDNATNNAGDMIDKYTLEMNRARQAIITTELSEIVSGAESLK